MIFLAKQINLDRLVANYVHRPKLKGVSDLLPLYAKSDSYNGGNDTTFNNKGFSKPEWVTESGNKYNSPNNIRRIFIGKSHVFIQYYKPIHGDSATGCWRRYTFSDEDNLESLVMKSNSGEIELLRSGFGAFGGSYWVTSNIEEIYITPLVLASKYYTSGNESFNRLVKNLIEVELNGTSKSNNTIANLPVIYSIFCGNYFDDFDKKPLDEQLKLSRKKFPRLRVLAYMSNIDEILESPGAQSIGSNLPTSFDDAKLTWFEYAKANNLLDCVINYCCVPFSKYEADWFDFYTRPGIYKFDDKILEDYRLSFKRKYEGLAEDRAKKGLPDTNHTNEKSELENWLDSYMTKKGSNLTEPVINFVFFRETIEEKQRVLREMSKEGRAKYSRLFNCNVT